MWRSFLARRCPWHNFDAAEELVLSFFVAGPGETVFVPSIMQAHRTQAQEAAVFTGAGTRDKRCRLFASFFLLPNI